MDIEKLKDVMTKAVMVVAYRAGDVSTEDGSYATTGTDEIIRLEQSLCEALGTEHDDIHLYEALGLIDSLRDYKSERDEALEKLAAMESQEIYGYDSSGDLCYELDKCLTSPDPIPLYANPVPADNQQSAGDWLPVSVALPPEGEPFQAFHERWVDEDFNVYGIRECHRYGDGTQYASAKWFDHQDCWIEDSEAPQLWRPYVKPGRCPSHESEQSAALLAMIDDKTEDKQLTQDEINDLQRLERIKNG